MIVELTYKEMHTIYLEKERDLRTHLKNVLEKILPFHNLESIMLGIKNNLSLEFLIESLHESQISNKSILKSIENSQIFTEFIKSYTDLCDKTKSMKDSIYDITKNFDSKNEEKFNEEDDPIYDINKDTPRDPTVISENPKFDIEMTTEVNSPLQFLRDYLKAFYDNAIINEITSTLVVDPEKLEHLIIKEEIIKCVQELCLINDEFKELVKQKFKKFIENTLLHKLEITDDENLYEKIFDKVYSLCEVESIKEFEELCEDDQEQLIIQINNSEIFNFYKKFLFSNSSNAQTKQLSREQICENILLKILKENKVKNKNNLYDSVVKDILNSKTLNSLINSKFIPNPTKLKIKEQIKNLLEFCDINMEVENVENHVEKQNEESKENEIKIEKVEVNETNAKVEIKYEINLNYIIHLIKLFKDQQNNALEEKFIICKEEIFKFNKIFNINSDFIREDTCEGLIINYEEMNKIKCQFLGVMGRGNNILNYLQVQFKINEPTLIQLQNSFQSNGTGIYLLPINKSEEKNNKSSQLQFVQILWSKDDSDFEEISERKNFVKLVRYLTQLCNSNVISLGNNDINKIMIENKRIESARIQSYVTVNKELEKENFEISKGFKINSPIQDFKFVKNEKLCGIYTEEYKDGKKETKKWNKSINQTKLKEFNLLFNKYKIICDIDIDIHNDKDISHDIFKFISMLSLNYQEELNSLIIKAKWDIKKQVKVYDPQIEDELRKRKLLLTLIMYKQLYENEYDNFIEEYYHRKLKNKYTYLNVAIDIINDDKSTLFNRMKKLVIHIIPKWDFLDKDKRTLLIEYLKENQIPYKDEDSTYIKNIKNGKKDVLQRVVKLTNDSKIFLFKFITKINSDTLIKYIDIHDKKVSDILEENELERDKNDIDLKCSKEEDIFCMILNYIESISSEYDPLHFEDVKNEMEKIKINNKLIQMKNSITLNYFSRLIESINKVKKNENILKIKNIQCVSSNNINNFNIFFEEEICEEPKRIICIQNLMALKNEIQTFKNNCNHIITPELSSLKVIRFEIANSEEILEIVKISNDYLIVIIKDSEFSKIKIFDNRSSANANLVFSKQYNKIIKLCDYNEKTKETLLFSIKDGNSYLAIYSITGENNFKYKLDICISDRHGIMDCKHIKLDSPNNCIWIIDDNSVLCRLDLKKNTIFKFKNLELKKNIQGIWLVPNSSCLLILEENSFIPVITDTYNILPPIKLCKDTLGKCFTIGIFENQIHFIFKLAKYDCIFSKILHTSAGRSQLEIEKIGNNDSNRLISQDKQTSSLLEYIFHIYDKFPIYSILKSEEEQLISQNFMFYYSEGIFTEEIERKIREKLEIIENKIKKTEKPNPGLNLQKNCRFLNPSLNLPDLFSILFTTPFSIGDWIQELICFLPIQIARAENNCLEIMTDGLNMAIDNFNNASELKLNISLGLYETILKSWKGPIKVISSMGKQSTGKSYTLNHLSGSSFAISGARCTDGCWLTIKVTKNCLYVLLDFEGLGSYERSEQEDMLLSVLNSSISNATLFKTEYRLDRELDNMFKRFNMGGNLLKGSDKIFKGSFLVLIKDVIDRDVDSLVKEFREKICMMINKEKEKNFISSLYSGKFSFFPFPSLESSEYYSEMINLRDHINNFVEPVYKDGVEFLDFIKLILAKIATQDFTPIDRQHIDIRFKNLQDLLYITLMYGQTTIDSENSLEDFCLRSMDDISKKVNSKNIIHIENLNLKIEYEDSSIRIESKSNFTFSHIFWNQLKKTHENHLQWHIAFNEFIEKVIKFRINRVEEWINLNLEKWLDNTDFSDMISSLRNQLNSKGKEILLNSKLCQTKCKKCYAKCVKPVYHDDMHECDSDSHKCLDDCSYCAKKGILTQCKNPFGHEENHICRNNSHICGHACIYSANNFCEKECSEISGHSGDHKCSIKEHKCKLICSLDGCESLCELKADIPHTVHKCSKEQCTKTCSVGNCKMKCSSHDHFHGESCSTIFKQENNISELDSDFRDENGKCFNSELHFCGNEHQCSKDCETPGFCKVYVERKIIEEEFKGKKSSFKYTKHYVSQGEKLKCNKMIPAFNYIHEGEHIHSLDPCCLHQCDTKCPTCENLCDKPYGHPEKHSTAHGNMINCHFISNQEDLDLGEHKYVVGESAQAEMCHIFCQTLGRGHIHVVDCTHKNGNCKWDPIKDKRRHQSCKYGPDENIHKDEMWHDEYWNSINFEDPCQESEKENFNLCPYKCGSDGHSNTEIVNCELEIWHPKINKPNSNSIQRGFISSDGHQYPCSHSESTEGYHFLMALDGSGSMSGKPWNNLISAVKQFINSRSNFPNEKISIIIYDTQTVVPYEFCNLADISIIKLKKLFIGGGTSFSTAISKAREVFKMHITSKHTPVFIFMSDGGDFSGINEMENLYNEFKQNGLITYILGFGDNVLEKQLKDLSEKANGFLHYSIESIDLKKSFQSISSVLGAKISVAKSFK